MSSNISRYMNTSYGRNVIISLFISFVLVYLAILIPLAPAVDNAWYSRFYKDVTLPESERFNWTLVLVESAIFTLLFLFLLIFFGSYQELNNRIPSWNEFIFSFLITIILSVIFPRISVGEGTFQEISGSGYNHFTKQMQTAVVLFTILGMVLMMLYVYFTAPQEEVKK